MNERFETLYKLDENLYNSGSPVILSVGLLLKDKKTGSIITQLKFLSISEIPIKALKISINAYDVSGKQVEGIEEYQYLDLSVKNGEYFGFNKAIIMPNNVTRSIRIQDILVVFEQGTYELTGSDLFPLDKPKNLLTEFSEPDMIKQYQIDASTQGEYIPKSIGNLWICACGKPNSTDVCSACHTTKEKIFDAYNPNILKEHLGMRLEKEKIEKERKAELEAIAKKQKEEKEKLEATQKAREEAERKKRIKRYLIIGCVAIAVIIAIFGINLSIERQNSIEDIEKYISEMKYEHAFDRINQSNLSASQKRAYIEKIQPKMVEQYNDTPEKYQVLNVDGLLVYKNDNVIYYLDENGKQIDIYRCREDNAQYRNLGGGVKYWIGGERIQLGFDYIYANGYILFIEYGEEHNNDEIKTTYKYIRAVNIETGFWETLDYNTHSTCFKKLYDGRILLDHYYSDTVFNPYTGKVDEKRDLLTEEERNNIIYDTDSK